MRPDSPSPVIPFLIACAGIATFSAMDVLMKGLSIDIGAYNAVLWRTGAGTILSGLLYFASGPAMPDARTLRIHAVRSLFVAGMAVSFFWGLARLPMAEAIAIAFIAPLTPFRFEHLPSANASAAFDRRVAARPIRSG